MNSLLAFLCQTLNYFIQSTQYLNEGASRIVCISPMQLGTEDATLSLFIRTIRKVQSWGVTHMHPGIRACLLITTLYKRIRIFLTKIQQKTCLNHPQNSYLSSRALSEPTDILRMCVYIFRNCDAKRDIGPYQSYNTRYPQESPKSHFL